MDSLIADEPFMDVVRDYPAIYQRSSVEFRDKNKKLNSWRRVAEATSMDVSKAMARYNSIRTQFSRYIKSLRGKSGQGRDDFGKIKPEFEYLRWLITYIKHRETTTNIKIEEEESSSTPSPLSVSPNASDEENDVSTNDHEMENGVENSLLDPEIEIIEDDQQESLTQPTKQSTPKHQPPRKKQKSSTPSSDKRPWSKCNKPVSIDEKLSRSIDQINKAIKESDNADNKTGQDEETLYCLSLVSRLKAFDGRVKSTVRFQIEKVFHEAECGMSYTSFQVPYQRYNQAHDPVSYSSVPYQMAPGMQQREVPDMEPSQSQTYYTL